MAKLCCCCGDFGSLSIRNVDADYGELFQIPLELSEDDSTRLGQFNIVQLFTKDADPDRPVVVVSGLAAPRVYDVMNKSMMKISFSIPETSGSGCVSSLDTFPSTFTREAMVVAGQSEFDASSGDLILEFEIPSEIATSRRCDLCQNVCVSEWSEVILAGGYRPGVAFVGHVLRFDSSRAECLSVYECDCPVSGVAVDTLRNCIYSTAGEAKTVRIWSRDTDSCQDTLRLTKFGHSLFYDKAKNRLLVGAGIGDGVEVWDVRNTTTSVAWIDMEDCGMIKDIDQVDEDRYVLGCGTGIAILDVDPVRTSVRYAESPGAVTGVCVLRGETPTQPDSE